MDLYFVQCNKWNNAPGVFSGDYEAIADRIREGKNIFYISSTYILKIDMLGMLLDEALRIEKPISKCSFFLHTSHFEPIRKTKTHHDLCKDELDVIDCCRQKVRKECRHEVDICLLMLMQEKKRCPIYRRLLSSDIVREGEGSLAVVLDHILSIYNGDSRIKMRNELFRNFVQAKQGFNRTLGICRSSYI